MASGNKTSPAGAVRLTTQIRFSLVFLCGLLAGAQVCPKAAARQTHHTSTAAASNKPLNKAALEKALRTGGIKSSELVAIIHKRGVDFPLDRDTELELRGAGADANIIEAVGQSYHPANGTTSVATNHASEPTPSMRTGTTPPSATPPPPPQPPAPTFRDVTLPTGTVLPVQMTQTLDSGTTAAGQGFNGVLSQDIIIGNMVVVQRGTAVLGHVTEVKDAAHFAGSSKLTIALTNLLSGSTGETLAVNASPITREGTGRGRSTAVKTGGGAAVGAVLGGIFGGGKGAAIGAAAGGGAGAGSSAITRGEQVQFPSESVVQFSLISPLLVRVALSPAVPSPDSPRQPLRR